MIAVPFIYFSIFFLVMYYKQKSFNIGSYILLIYIVTSFFAIMIDVLGLYGNYGVSMLRKFNLLPTFTYCLLLTITILPFFKFRSDKIQKITLQNPQLFDLVSYFFMIVFVVVIVSTGADILALRGQDLGSVRINFYNDMHEVSDESIPLYMYVPNIMSRFYPIIMLFFFYSFTFLKRKMWFNLGLFLSTFSMLINSILTAARTQVIFWLLLFFLFYFLFKPHLTKERNRKLITLFAVFGSVIILYLGAVTVSRFEERHDNGTVNSLVGYTGQMFINYCDVFENYRCKEITIDRIVPITSKYILENDFVVAQYRDLIEYESGVTVNVFFTFLGDAMLDFSRAGMIIYVLIFYLLCRLILYRKDIQTIDFAKLILFALLVCIPVQGVFAFVYLRVTDSYYIIGCILLYILFQHKSQQKLQHKLQLKQ